MESSSTSRFKLWSELVLEEYTEKFVIKSVESPDQGFSISRLDGNIDKLNSDDPSGSPSKVSTIYGVAGTIRLLAGAILNWLWICPSHRNKFVLYRYFASALAYTDAKYRAVHPVPCDPFCWMLMLEEAAMPIQKKEGKTKKGQLICSLSVGTYVLVITSRKEVGTYLGFPVFLVTSMKFLSCNGTSGFLTSQEKRDEDYYMTLLKIVESTPGLYFSYGTDITLKSAVTFNSFNFIFSLEIDAVKLNSSGELQGDPRFVWNRNLLEELIENKTGEMKLKNSPAVIKLLSRRCTRRLGTRMWRRGANLGGDTANFIETEQLLDIEGHISSFLQVRGSIPLLWEQIVDLSYKPRLNIIHHEQTSEVVERHFNDILQRYGGCIAVDLTDKHGDEGLLSMAYAEKMQKLVQKLPNVRYVSFDFHQVCGNGNFENIRLLYDQLAEDFEKQGYFLLDPEGKVLAEQEGVVRSNCIDCLDRTNVTQSYLGQKSLNSQLQRVGAISSTECISMFGEDFEIFKTLWVDHGDEISLEYSGTHALKRDLVRYGKQTMAGIIKDGMSALSRYYLNNFQDGVRQASHQDAIDLISGRYTVNRNGPSPSQPRGFDTLSYLPVASALLVGGLTVTSITLNQAGRQAHQYLSSVICAGLTAGVMAVIKANGRQICSRPRLCGLL
ncbi:UNVERIFIED_CONTAM: Phosphoinositide phosphatase SAC8 [Sesamum calycinum]|uniref:Phosphoinositide phosphatase SAC8 n=1 Tax=Sesamum calycinum TaxID=2727403 RepID=A0AAW2JBA6_9LAMI